MPHGFRSSFRDWAAEMTDHPREVIEAALAHMVQNKVEAAYARSDLFERRRLLDGRLGELPRRESQPRGCSGHSRPGGSEILNRPLGVCAAERWRQEMGRQPTP